MGKVDDNKRMKLTSMLDSAFQLFTDKGLAKTSISDIVESSGVAKGTFYLYFKDKFDIRNKLVVYQSTKVLRIAYEATIEHLEEFPPAGRPCGVLRGACAGSAGRSSGSHQSDLEKSQLGHAEAGSQPTSDRSRRF